MGNVDDILYSDEDTATDKKSKNKESAPSQTHRANSKASGQRERLVWVFLFVGNFLLMSKEGSSPSFDSEMLTVFECWFCFLLVHSGPVAQRVLHISS